MCTCVWCAVRLFSSFYPPLVFVHNPPYNSVGSACSSPTICPRGRVVYAVIGAVLLTRTLFAVIYRSDWDGSCVSVHHRTEVQYSCVQSTLIVVINRCEVEVRCLCGAFLAELLWEMVNSVLFQADAAHMLRARSVHELEVLLRSRFGNITENHSPGARLPFFRQLWIAVIKLIGFLLDFGSNFSYKTYTSSAETWRSRSGSCLVGVFNNKKTFRVVMKCSHFKTKRASGATLFGETAS